MPIGEHQVQWSIKCRNLGFYRIVSKTENVEEAGAADTPSRAAPFVTGLQSGTPQKILEEMVLLIKKRKRQREGRRKKEKERGRKLARREKAEKEGKGRERKKKTGR